MTNSTIPAATASKILEDIRKHNEHEIIPCFSRDAWFQAMNTVREGLMSVYAFFDYWCKLIPLRSCKPLMMGWIIEVDPHNILYTTEENTNISLERAVIDGMEVAYMVFTSKK